jgi:hypothetical protein
MNTRWPVVARHIDRVTCDHVECHALRALAQEAHRLHRYDLVNTAERELSRCPERTDS